MKINSFNYLWIAGLSLVFLSSCGIKQELVKINTKLNQFNIDTDQDGVADIHDRDNATPAEAMVYGNGTAVDTDHDGIPDFKDSEPLSPAGAKVDEKGKALDQDNDGVPDVLDQEPNTPNNALVDIHGKAITFAAIAAATGEDAAKAAAASASKTESRGQVASNSANIVFFDVSSSKIRHSEIEKIMNIALTLKNNPNAKITIVGYSPRQINDICLENIVLFIFGITYCKRECLKRFCYG